MIPDCLLAYVFPSTFHPHNSTRNPLLDLDYGTDNDDDADYDDDVEMDEVAESLLQHGPILSCEDSHLSQQSPSLSPAPRTSVSDVSIISHKRDRTSSVDEELSASVERENSQAQSAESSSSGKLSGWVKGDSVSISSKRQKLDFPGKLSGYLYVVIL